MQAHPHNRYMSGGHITQLVVGENVLPLLYQGFADNHCVGLNFAVPSIDQHLKGGHRRVTEQYARASFLMDTKLASFSRY